MFFEWAISVRAPVVEEGGTERLLQLMLVDGLDTVAVEQTAAEVGRFHP